MTAGFWIEEAEKRIPLVVLKTGGRMGLEQAKDLKERAASLLEEGCKYLVLDMSGISFIGSSAFGVLIGLADEMKKSGADLYLVGVTQHVMRVFELLRLEEVFAFEDDTETLLAKLGL